MRWVAPLAAALPLIVAATQVHGKGLIATSNALSFMPWMFVRALVTGPWWLVVLAGYCCLCTLLAVRARVRTRWLVRWVASAIAVITFFGFAYVSFGSWHARAHTSPSGWLDARTDSDVIAVWVKRPTSGQAFALWELYAMNRNLARVYFVRQPDILGPATKLAQGSGGRLLDRGEPISPRYALTSYRTPLVGTLIARSSGLALYRVQPPLRLATSAARN
jgi:energy-coupling factor transporter transmembrane protein EcfT